MSRSALWRQEANVKERERKADETFQRVLEEGKVRSHSIIFLNLTSIAAF